MAENDQAGAPPESSPIALEDRVARLFGGGPPEPPAAAPKAAEETPQPTDQAEEPDAAASEEAAPDTDAESETAPQFEEVEWDGEKFAVPAKLKEAIVKASDYTKKTQEVAEARRLVEFEQKKLQTAAAERKFAESVNTEVSTLAQIDQQLSQYRNIDVSSLSDRELTLMQYQVSQLKEKKEETQRALDAKYRDFQSQQQKALDELLKEGREIVRKNIPNFNEKVASDIAAQFRKEGYSDEEIASSLDPRIVKLAYKAAQFDALQAQKSKVSANVAQAKPLGKATAPPPMPKAVRENLNFRKAIAKAKPGTPEHRSLVENRVAQIFGR